MLGVEWIGYGMDWVWNGLQKLLCFCFLFSVLLDICPGYATCLYFLWFYFIFLIRVRVNTLFLVSLSYSVRQPSGLSKKKKNL